MKDVIRKGNFEFYPKRMIVFLIIFIGVCFWASTCKPIKDCNNMFVHVVDIHVPSIEEILKESEDDQIPKIEYTEDGIPIYSA